MLFPLMEKAIHFLLTLMMDMIVAEKEEEAIHLQLRHFNIVLALTMDMLVTEKAEKSFHLQLRHFHILLYHVCFSRSMVHQV